ncbi:MAG: DegV family protein [Bacillota bacterium]|nr:DegV family protein [Bacillota bacterium]
MEAVKRVKLVTHTGSDMQPEEAEMLNIELIPDRVVFGEEEYRNMTEINAEEFYRKLSGAKEIPTSSQPSPGDFLRAFRKAAEGADEILCLMITSKMSGCYSAAVSAAGTAKRQGIKTPIYVYDTMQCSHGMAQMVRAAARLAGEGCSAEEIMKKLDSIQSLTGVYFVLDTLENARKGGRVGAVTSRTVSLLGIKPLLYFKDGLVREYGIARSFEGGIKRITDKFIEDGDVRYPVTVFHAAAPERAEQLKDIILQQVPEANVKIGTVGPVIGIYTGAGCAGIAFTGKESK